MNLLIIDNYDSFTYNLAHYAAELPDVQVHVLSNDAYDAAMALRDAVDAVIVSPGPGRPSSARDLGVSSEIIEEWDVPVLGVCLGHQALIHLYGGEVGRAPQQMHGRTSLVHHDGDDLFAGIPSPFKAMRYHSLAATRVPDELVVTAWADNVVMGVKHRAKPQWGVQFHPESIGSEFGRQILGNFASLCSKSPALHEAPDGQKPGSPWTQVGGPGRERRDAPKPPAATVRHRVVQSELSSCEIFRRCFGGDHSEVPAFFLDSSDGQGISIMGDARGPLARTLVLKGDQFAVRGVACEAVFGADHLLDWLSEDLANPPAGSAALPFSFSLGWVGYLGYEALERARVGDEAERVGLIFADRAVVLVHATGQIYALAIGSESQCEGWFDELEAAVSLAPDPPVPVVLSRPANLRWRHSPEVYQAMIRQALEYIRDGETYEVCLTNAILMDRVGDPWALYHAVRSASPVPYGAYLRIGDATVLSASPECFLQVAADGFVTTKPIKGTRPRGQSPAQDARLARQLAASEKDRAENVMIVDLLRNDLSRVSSVGSVSVPQIFEVESYSNVHQLVSTVVSQLRAGESVSDLLRVAFPGGSMTGAPKVRTMELLRQLEQAPRGIYSGCLGYLSLNGAAAFSIIIRTMVITSEGAYLGTGGAITALSDPEEEFDEIVAKARSFLGPLRSTNLPILDRHYRREHQRDRNPEDSI